MKALQSLLKEDKVSKDAVILLDEMYLQPNDQNVDVSSIVESISNEIQDSELDEKSTEISVYLAGFITKKLLKKSLCETCIHLLKENLVEEGTGYLNMLNRGGLKIPSKPLSSHVNKGFAVIDVVKEQLCRHIPDKIRSGAEQVLRLHVHDDDLFLCDQHYEWGVTLVNRSIVNVFFNNEQGKENSAIRKDEIASFKARQTRKRRNDDI